MARVTGPCFAWLFSSKRSGVMDFQSAWLDAFSTEHRNYVLAILENGYTVTGWAESVAADPDSIISGNRDIVLSHVTLSDPEHSQDYKVPDKAIITINTRNIKILETATRIDEEEKVDV